jgi:general secretion pathway protein D
LRGLNQKKGADVMAQPMVTTRSGQSASIQVVDEFLYPTEYEPPELPQSVGILPQVGIVGGNDQVIGTEIIRSSGSFPVTPATPTAFEKRDIGITLEVLPVADENRQYVDITLNPQITDFEGFVNYGSPITSVYSETPTPITENAILMPVFSARKANTNITIADGATIVLGGLHQDRVENVNDKTPILGDLPIFGRLFQTKGVSHQSTVILFLVSVELQDPTGFPYRNR